MDTRRLPKLVFSDEDLPTIQYRRGQATEADLAVLDVDRSFEGETRRERVEILGLVNPEEGVAAEIEGLCTLDNVERPDVPRRRTPTVDELPAIPISHAAARRAHRRQQNRMGVGAAVALAVLCGFAGASTLLGGASPAPPDASVGVAVAVPVETSSAIPTAPVVVPGPAVVEAIVEPVQGSVRTATARKPSKADIAGKAPPMVSPTPRRIRNLVAQRATAANRTVTPASAVGARRVGPSGMQRKRPRKRLSKKHLDELDALLGL